MFGFLASISIVPIDDELREHVLALPNLVAYAHRAMQTWFPELAPGTAAASAVDRRVASNG